MKLDITKTFSTRTERIKSLDFHPSEPWVLSTLYSGKVEIWNHESNTLVKSIDVTNVPVRAGKFIARKNWIVVGSDDFQVRVYNYNTSEKIHQFEAHPDYLRCIEVHPTKPYILTSADDWAIRLWNWEANWRLEQVFEGHQHFIMGLKFNPKDPNTFASGCLDRTVKVWSLGSNTPNFTFTAHETKGVNYVDYYPLNDKPYIITASDDRTVKIWDYQTKSCVATLEGHTANVSFAIFHPELPLIISGAEDGTIKFWNANTYKLEKSLNYGLERCWCVASRKGSNLVALGFDAGELIVKLGDEEPIISMDQTGKIVYTKNLEVYSAVIKNSSAEGLNDGDTLPLTVKDLGNVEVFPNSLKHSPNGRFVAVVGDGEYIIYTALAWRNKTYGEALDFVWGQDASDYAVREPNNAIKIYKNFKLKNPVQFNYTAERLFGGALLGVKSNEGFIQFFDWESGQLVRRVDVESVVNVVWTGNGELLTIIGTDSSYVLRFDVDVFNAHLQEGDVDPEEGVEDCFEVLYELNEKITSTKWIGDVLLYITASNRLNYFVGDSTFSVYNFDKTMYLLDYLPRDNKVYLCDKDINIVSFNLSLAVLEYQTTVLRNGIEDAQDILANIPESEFIKISSFLKNQGYLVEALEISTDNEQKFELCLMLEKFDLALEIAKELDSQLKWNKLGDILLKKLKFKSAIYCFEQSQDLETLFLLYSSFNMSKKLLWLGEKAESLNKFNLSFNCYWLIGNLDKMIKLLELSGRFSEAAILGFKYGLEEDKLEKIVKVWQAELLKEGKVGIAEKLLIPGIDKEFAIESVAEAEPVAEAAPAAEAEIEAEPVAEPVAGPAPVEETVAE